jgi:hypothetical protein
MAATITWKTNEKAIERPIGAQPKGTKEGELITFTVGSYLTHIPSNVACM